MATHETNLGLGLITGMFYHAPAGTALPVSPAEKLPATWKEVGDISADGISFTKETSTTAIRNMANQLKRMILTEHTETVTAPVMDTTEEALKAVLGEDAVTKTAATAQHGNLITASLSENELPPEEAFLFLMKDDDDLIAIGCSKGQVTSMDAVTFAPGSAITWTPTITGLDDGWKIIKDDGQKA